DRVWQICRIMNAAPTCHHVTRKRETGADASHATSCSIALAGAESLGAKPGLVVSRERYVCLIAENLAGLKRPPRKLLLSPPPPQSFLGVRRSAVRLASSHTEASR